MRKGTPKIRLVGCEAAVQEIRNRMPFRYGKAVLTAAPLLHLRVRVEQADGKQASGLAADCLPPLWFDKDPEKRFATAAEVARQLAPLAPVRSRTIIDEIKRGIGELRDAMDRQTYVSTLSTKEKEELNKRLAVPGSLERLMKKRAYDEN